mmetsp:Transcript_5015/g.8728  ORF Transcript_5015/g.8728 Transcript_5015/m.8728 type:complete len:177 (-) Transcript_5015:452-982(-)
MDFGFVTVSNTLLFGFKKSNKIQETRCGICMNSEKSKDSFSVAPNSPGEMTHFEPIKNLLFVQLGTGTDTHGQDPTKASYRAIKNAISSNSIPSSSWLIPGGPSHMRVHVKLGVPEKYESILRPLEALEALPYGIKSVQVVHGGLISRSGIALTEQGDSNDNDDMIVVVAAVEVGY